MGQRIRDTRREGGRGDTLDSSGACCTGDILRGEGVDNPSSVSLVTGTGVGTVITVWVRVAGISGVSCGVTAGSEDCGVDMGFGDVVVGVEGSWDGPLTEPSERRSSWWAKPNDQTTVNKILENLLYVAFNQVQYLSVTFFQRGPRYSWNVSPFSFVSPVPAL